MSVKKYIELYYLIALGLLDRMKPVFLIMLLFLCLIFGLDKMSYIQCKTYSGKTNMNYEYSASAGCFVQHEGNWIHKDNLRIVINK